METDDCYCSFCGREKEKVMFGSSRAFICDRCVKEAAYFLRWRPELHRHVIRLGQFVIED